MKSQRKGWAPKVGLKTLEAFHKIWRVTTVLTTNPPWRAAWVKIRAGQQENWQCGYALSGRAV
jgi:hypothetical protein